MKQMRMTGGMQTLAICSAISLVLLAKSMDNEIPHLVIQAQPVLAFSRWLADTHQRLRPHAVVRTATMSASRKTKGSQDLMNARVSTYLPQKKTQKQSMTMFQRLMPPYR